MFIKGFKLPTTMTFSNATSTIGITHNADVGHDTDNTISSH